jgi:hypothetical protein
MSAMQAAASGQPVMRDFLHLLLYRSSPHAINWP